MRTGSDGTTNADAAFMAVMWWQETRSASLMSSLATASICSGQLLALLAGRELLFPPGRSLVRPQRGGKVKQPKALPAF